MLVILHGLELLDVVVPDHCAREQRGQLRVPQRVPDNLVLRIGCIKDGGSNLHCVNSISCLVSLLIELSALLVT